MKQELELDLRSFGQHEAEAAPLVRGVLRLFRNMGYGALTEFRLSSGHRVDVLALNPRGRMIVAEVKSSAGDFRADDKWREYERFCDQFFFAVAEDFPRDILPPEVGLIVADRFGAAIVRDVPVRARRKRAASRFTQRAG